MFRLRLACVLAVNTQQRVGVDWPRTYGAGVRLDTGEVFTAAFESHGPDEDIRYVGRGETECSDINNLRSMWCNEGLHNIYCHETGRIVIKPFQYGVISSAHRWLKYENSLLPKYYFGLIRQSDEFLLHHCSTSPKVEPPTFCNMIRSV